jgi:hypothetical protein
MDAFLKRELGWMVGKTIANVRAMDEDELGAFGWFPGYGTLAIVVEFSDGSWFVPSQDAEGNAPGFVIHAGN